LLVTGGASSFFPSAGRKIRRPPFFSSTSPQAFQLVMSCRPMLCLLARRPFSLFPPPFSFRKTKATDASLFPFLLLLFLAPARVNLSLLGRELSSSLPRRPRQPRAFDFFSFSFHPPHAGQGGKLQPQWDGLPPQYQQRRVFFFFFLDFLLTIKSHSDGNRRRHSPLSRWQVVSWLIEHPPSPLFSFSSSLLTGQAMYGRRSAAQLFSSPLSPTR